MRHSAVRAPVLYQHLQHLLEEERIALRARQDRLTHVRGHLRLAEQRGDEPCGLVRRERREGERRRVLLPAPQVGRRSRNSGRAVQTINTRVSESTSARCSTRLSNAADAQCTSSTTSTVSWRRQSSEVSLPRVRQRLTDVLGVGCDNRGAGHRKADRPRDRLEDVALSVVDDGSDGGPELLQRGVDGVGIENPGLGLRRLGERPIRDALPVRQAPPFQHSRAREPLEQLGEQPRLPDARLTEERHELRDVLACDPRRDRVEDGDLLLLPMNGAVKPAVRRAGSTCADRAAQQGTCACFPFTSMSLRGP